MSSATVPVTFLAGFLGSGKTTLVNRILAGQHGRRVAVVVNEFGDVGIDGRLVVGVEDEVIELANGCVCCTVRGDLSATLRRLIARHRRPLLPRKLDRVLIEASGLASPGPAVQTLFVDPELQGSLRFDGVVTLAHAAQIVDQLEANPEAAEQVAYADRLLLNHIDRVDAAGLDAAEAALSRCNGSAPIRRCERAEVGLEVVLDLEDVSQPRTDVGGTSTRHTSGVGTIALQSTEPLDLHRLKMWLQFLATRRTHELMRAKGVLRCADHAEAVVVQSVYQWLELGPAEGPAPRESTLVLIGRGFDEAELRRGWAACHVQATTLG